MLSVILLYILIMLLSTLKCDQAFNLWRQVELTSELQFDSRDTEDWVRKCFIDFNAGKSQLVSSDQSNSSGGIDVKMDGSFLDHKANLTMPVLSLSFKLYLGSYNVSIDKLPPRKLEPSLDWRSSFLVKLFFISMNLPYELTWNIVVMSGIVLPAATWTCQISCRNQRVGYFTFCLSGTLGSSSKCSLPKSCL